MNIPWLSRLAQSEYSAKIIVSLKNYIFENEPTALQNVYITDKYTLIRTPRDSPSWTVITACPAGGTASSIDSAISTHRSPSHHYTRPYACPFPVIVTFLFDIPWRSSAVQSFPGSAPGSPLFCFPVFYCPPSFIGLGDTAVQNGRQPFQIVKNAPLSTAVNPLDQPCKPVRVPCIHR